MPPKEMKMMPLMSARIDSKPGGSMKSVVAAQAAYLSPSRSSSSWIAALPLDAVAHVARGQDERDDQHHGVEVVAHQPDEPEAPDGRQRAGDDRRPPSRALAEREAQDEDHRRDRGQEQEVYQVFVVVAEAADDRLAGDEDLVVVVLVLLDDLLDVVEQLAVVEPALVE